METNPAAAQQQSDQPLGRKTAGTRAQRRLARAQQAKCNDHQNDNDNNEQAVLRRPTIEIERQIEQQIAQRIENNKAATSRIETVSFEPTILGKYEYLDHTADIQLHSWGSSMEEALEQLVVAMFGYMTELQEIQMDDGESEKFASKVLAKAHDLNSLVFAFLQEWLYIFHDTGFVARQVKVSKIDLSTFSIESSGRGEKMDLTRHIQGTEIKAITYSNLQIRSSDDGGHWDIWVVVDI